MASACPAVITNVLPVGSIAPTCWKSVAPRNDGLGGMAMETATAPLTSAVGMVRNRSGLISSEQFGSPSGRSWFSAMGGEADRGAPRGGAVEDREGAGDDEAAIVRDGDRVDRAVHGAGLRDPGRAVEARDRGAARSARARSTR